ncbi:phospho-sugar mutase [Streptomyces oceani]|uniref:Phosphomannomutase n=1 Tax=Streptomyces oceani TaxID=1075402 RepID=A0A1E7KIE3_9ACTN|nr:phospho-sugar mutase [Streptomyces oceani]OEV03651.1 phosphomannomutase [Streptomyces oceani]
MHRDPIEQAHAWLAEDPDPETREELRQLLDTAPESLADRFAGTLQFGTAGLRGELGAGPMRMNRSVVIRAAAGLAAYLRTEEYAGGGPAAAEPAGPAAPAGLVVIGYDARYKSAEFARDTAAVLTGAGLRAALLPRPLPTPVLAFAIRHLDAVAGIMVTASHNPPGDNGYKVYLGDGSQLVPPHDTRIAAEIAAVGPLTGVPRPEEGWTTLDEDVVDAYLARAGGVLTEGSPRGIRVVHTALHGVGGRTLREAFVRAGFPAPVPVTEQAEPDPDFPTVAFPNPEEPGAMDLAFATARALEPAPDLVIANDPDADRCAVAVPLSNGPDGPDGPDPGPDPGAGWRMLRGDEVGALLATHLVHRHARGTFATTIVSSALLARIAVAAGLPYEETLTGFKWLARVDGLRYAYEEALGYCVDPAGVRDKDGITAALLVAELAAELRESGRTLTDLLDDLAVEHGLHATDQLSVRVTELSALGTVMARLRDRPPRRLADLPVTATEDLTAGTAVSAVSGTPLPPTDGLRYVLADGTARVVVRPSGTEPKLKCYLEVVVPVSDASALPAARTQAREVLARLAAELAEAAGI